MTGSKEEELLELVESLDVIVEEEADEEDEDEDEEEELLLAVLSWAEEVVSPVVESGVVVEGACVVESVAEPEGRVELRLLLQAESRTIVIRNAGRRTRFFFMSVSLFR